VIAAGTVHTFCTEAVQDLIYLHCSLPSLAALQTLLTAGLAPLAGSVADQVSLAAMFCCFGSVLLVLNHVCFAELSVLTVCGGGGGGSAVEGGHEEKTFATHNETVEEQSREVVLVI
jgi:hypothetical protein